MNRVAAMPEVIPHHDQALHVLAVALTQGLTSSVSRSDRFACSHCSNWSRTSRTLDPFAVTGFTRW